MNDQKTSPLLYVITTLVVVNIAATCWLISKVSSAPTTVTRSLPQPLPSYMNKEVKRQIYNEFKTAFNSKEFSSFWNLFSDLARSKMNRQNTERVYLQLLDYFSEVEEGTFSHYEYSGRKGSLTMYVLYYNVSLSAESKFGSRGELKMTISDDGQDYGIVGAYLVSKAE